LVIGNDHSDKRGAISASGVAVRVSILVLALFISTNVITSYETRTIEPEAEWEIIVDSYDWPIDYWEDVAFYNATEGWIVGEGDVGPEAEDLGHVIIMHTSNGGKNWGIVYSEKMSVWGVHIEIVDVDTVWLATNKGLLHTENRGASWEYSPGTRSSGFAAVKFKNRSYGLASFNKGLSYTEDGGETWNEIETWSYNESLFEINFVGDDIIWACGYSGIYRSSDSGTSWTKQRNRTAYAMSILNETEAWAIGWTFLGITHCTDSATWSEDMTVSRWSDSYDTYYDIEFIDENNGWLVGSNHHSVAYTPDGGMNWYSQMSSTPRDLKAVDFINETHGWAVGWHGIIARTTTGNRFGQKLIVNGDSIPWMGVTNLRIPKSVSFVNTILLVALPILFLIERVVFVIRRDKNTRDREVHI
jgi:photosystem II stability/assembly factor-like uncharacterized protein